MKHWIMVVAVLLSAFGASAQHDVSVDFDTRVTGPNSFFTMAMTMSPTDIDISGFAIRVYYDSTQVELIQVLDNTEQYEAGVTYSPGPVVPSNKFPNTNAYRNIGMTTDFQDLVKPDKIALLRFRAKPEFSDPDNRVWVYLEGFTSEPGLMVYDPESEDGFVHIPTTYNNRSTPVPVTLSGFSLE